MQQLVILLVTYSTQCTQLATRLSTSQQSQQDRKP